MYLNIFNCIFFNTIELKVLSGIEEEITVKEFTSGEFAEVACIVLRFALVMCQPQFSSAKECCVSAEFANLRFIYLNVKCSCSCITRLYHVFTNVKYIFQI